MNRLYSFYFLILILIFFTFTDFVFSFSGKKRIPDEEVRSAGSTELSQTLINLKNKVKTMNEDFEKKYATHPENKEWVKKKLSHMVVIDQLVRSEFHAPSKDGHSLEDQKESMKRLIEFIKNIDSIHTLDLKNILLKYNWVTISQFGAQADRDAWLLVQHSDQDTDFQKKILSVLESLLPQKETNSINYAYLFDRVAVSEKRLQRFGTQGKCVGPGKWETFPIEDPKKVNLRRKDINLEPMPNYKLRFKTICHSAE